MLITFVSLCALLLCSVLLSLLLCLCLLGVLAPYRGRGIGAKLLRQILEYAETRRSIADVFLHVQSSNEDAMTFYKKQGFEVTGEIKDYYKRIQPSNCFVLSKKFVHLNMGGGLD